MKVILARSAGFCWGVRRAVEKVIQVAESSGLPVYTLGPLIHNPQTVDLLESKNVRAVGSPDRAGGGTLAIRAHGISPQLREEVRRTGRPVTDATCPDVGVIASAVKKHHALGYFVVILGKAGHAEVVGLQGYAPDRSAVVRGAEEVQALPDAERVCLVSQSTMSDEEFEEVARAVRQRYRGAKDVRVLNTICDDTRSRQREVVEIARQVDAMVVVGGRNSSNTNHLAALARATGTRTVHVETEDELQPQEFAECLVVGVTAGSSTPNWLIQNVVTRLESFEGARRDGAAAARRALELLVCSNLYLAGGAAALAALVLLVLGLRPLWPALAGGALFAFAAHTFNQHLLGPRLRVNDPCRASLFGAFPRLVWAVVGLAAAAGVLLCLPLGWAPALYLAVFLALSASYRLAWVPGRRLRTGARRAVSEIPGSKDVFMAGAWACLLTGIPFLAAPGARSWAALAAFGIVFALIAARSALFDLRDIQGDRLVGKETLPIVLGPARTRLLAGGGLAAAALLLGISVGLGACRPVALWALLPIAAAVANLSLAGRSPSRRQAGFELLLDGALYAAGLAALLGWLL